MDNSSLWTEAFSLSSNAISRTFEEYPKHINHGVSLQSLKDMEHQTIPVVPVEGYQKLSTARGRSNSEISKPVFSPEMVSSILNNLVSYNLTLPCYMKIIRDTENLEKFKHVTDFIPVSFFNHETSLTDVMRGEQCNSLFPDLESEKSVNSNSNLSNPLEDKIANKYKEKLCLSDKFCNKYRHSHENRKQTDVTCSNIRITAEMERYSHLPLNQDKNKCNPLTNKPIGTRMLRFNEIKDSDDKRSFIKQLLVKRNMNVSEKDDSIVQCNSEIGKHPEIQRLSFCKLLQNGTSLGLKGELSHTDVFTDKTLLIIKNKDIILSNNNSTQAGNEVTVDSKENHIDYSLPNPNTDLKAITVLFPLPCNITTLTAEHYFKYSESSLLKYLNSNYCPSISQSHQLKDKSFISINGSNNIKRIEPIVETQNDNPKFQAIDFVAILKHHPSHHSFVHSMATTAAKTIPVASDDKNGIENFHRDVGTSYNRNCNMSSIPFIDDDYLQSVSPKKHFLPRKDNNDGKDEIREEIRNNKSTYETKSLHSKYIAPLVQHTHSSPDSTVYHIVNKNTHQIQKNCIDGSDADIVKYPHNIAVRWSSIPFIDDCPTSSLQDTTSLSPNENQNVKEVNAESETQNISESDRKMNSHHDNDLAPLIKNETSIRLNSAAADTNLTRSSTIEGSNGQFENHTENVILNIEYGSCNRKNNLPLIPFIHDVQTSRQDRTFLSSTVKRQTTEEYKIRKWKNNVSLIEERQNKDIIHPFDDSVDVDATYNSINDGDTFTKHRELKNCELGFSQDHQLAPDANKSIQFNVLGKSIYRTKDIGKRSKDDINDQGIKKLFLQNDTKIKENINYKEYQMTECNKKRTSFHLYDNDSSIVKNSLQDIYVGSLSVPTFSIDFQSKLQDRELILQNEYPKSMKADLKENQIRERNTRKIALQCKEFAKVQKNTSLVSCNALETNSVFNPMTEYSTKNEWFEDANSATRKPGDVYPSPNSILGEGITYQKDKSFLETNRKFKGSNTHKRRNNFPNNYLEIKDCSYISNRVRKNEKQKSRSSEDKFRNIHSTKIKRTFHDREKSFHQSSCRNLNYHPKKSATEARRNGVIEDHNSRKKYYSNKHSKGRHLPDIDIIAESNDINDPGWDDMRKLKTDEARYRVVKQCWNSWHPPNPQKNLTYHSYRFQRTKNKLTRAREDRKRKATSSPIGLNPAKYSKKEIVPCTIVQDRKILDVKGDRNYEWKLNKDVCSRELRKIEENYKIQMEKLRITYDQRFEEIKHKIISNVERANAISNLTNCLKSDMSFVSRTTAMSRQIAKKNYENVQRDISDRYSNVINKLKDVRKEVFKFNQFYCGLNNIDPLVLEDRLAQGALILDDMYKEYNKYYGRERKALNRTNIH